MPDLDFNTMDNVQYDRALNDIAKDIFGEQDVELDKERVRLMQWALITLLLNKGIINQDEFTQSVDEATAFFTLLKRRFNIQNPDKSSDSTENA